MDNKVRINKYISESGIASRRKADEWIASGKVIVNGEVAAMGMKVDDSDEIIANGIKVFRENSFKLIAFNKPKGYSCTAHSGDESGIYANFDFGKELKYIGRLDKDSEGLLLLTNDGDLCNEISKARNWHEKEYEVSVNHPITDVFLRKMSEGVRILDANKDVWVVTKPCIIKRINERSFSIILTQGYNRQIRRMCEELGYKVVGLKRIRVVNIMLGDLKPGESRDVMEDELNELKRRIEGDKKAFKNDVSAVRKTNKTGRDKNTEPGKGQKKDTGRDKNTEHGKGRKKDTSRNKKNDRYRHR